MQKTTTVCDVCSKTKGGSNRWFQIYMSPGFKTNLKVVFDPKKYLYETSDEFVYDICGEKCLSDFISKHITTLDLR